MKKKYSILAAAALTAASLLTACGSGNKTSATTEAATTAAETTVAETTTEAAPAADLAVKVDTVDSSVNRDDGAAVIVSSYDTVSLSTGVDSYTDLADALNKFNDDESDRIQARLDSLQDAADANAGNKTDFDPYEVDSEVDVVSASPEYVSLLITEYTDTLGDTPEITARAVTFRSKDGAQVSLDDMVKDTSSLADTLASRLKSEYTDVTFNNDYASAIKSQVDGGNLVWNVDKNGVTFTFPEGQLASADDGELSVTIDRTADPDFFKN